MASRLTELVIDCTDFDLVARFWQQVLDWEEGERDETGVELIGPPGWPTLLFQPVPEGKSVKNRIHLDINATDRPQAEELERLLALGATPVDIGQGDPSWIVLADPEGNEFCLLHRTVPAED